jgi:hypothetical protein
MIYSEVFEDTATILEVYVNGSNVSDFSLGEQEVGSGLHLE